MVDQKEGCESKAAVQVGVGEDVEVTGVYVVEVGPHGKEAGTEVYQWQTEALA